MIFNIIKIQIKLCIRSKIHNQNMCIQVKVISNNIIKLVKMFYRMSMKKWIKLVGKLLLP